MVIGLVRRILRRVRVIDRGFERGPCWEWAGHLTRGYGRLNVAGVFFKAHRLALSVLGGVDVRPEHHVDHLCRNRACVNPTHLEAVTPKENTLRGESLAAHRARQTHCKAGHELAGSNVYRHPKRGTRECLTCKHSRRTNEGRRAA